MDSMMGKSRKADLGYLKDVSDFMRRRFEFALNPLNAFFQGNIIGIGIKRLYRAATNTTEEELLIKKKRKEEGREKLKQLMDEDRLAKKRLASVGIKGNYSNQVRNEKGQMMDSVGMTEHQMLQNIMSHQKGNLNEKEKTPYERMIEKIQGKSEKELADLRKQKKKILKENAHPSRKELAKTPAGQAMLFKMDQEEKDKKKPDGLFSNLFKGLGNFAAGAAGLAGGVLTTLLKAAPFAALIGGIVWMVFDGIQGYFKSKSWGVSQMNGVMGAVLGGTKSGWAGAFANAGKWALIGVGTGFLVGGPIGALAGGLLGAAIGGILGYIGGENLAKGFQGFDHLVAKFVYQIGNWVQDYISYILDLTKGDTTFSEFQDKKNRERIDKWSKKSDAAISQNEAFYNDQMKKNVKDRKLVKDPTTGKMMTVNKDILTQWNASWKKRVAEEADVADIPLDSNGYPLGMTDRVKNKIISEKIVNETPISHYNYKGGTAMTSGWAHVAEKEPEMIIPLSKVQKGFDNKQMDKLFSDFNGKKNESNYGKEIVNAVNKLTDLMDNKNFGSIINNTKNEPLDFDKLRMNMSYVKA
jgi:hypothetical protein